jgi:heat-inducible transcription repressor HrcA
MGELSKRAELILSLVIKEHIATAQPVGSLTLVQKYNLNVSPATVRNEMASLEAKGYLTHPHTSAGRVPTEKGLPVTLWKNCWKLYLCPLPKD